MTVEQFTQKVIGVEAAQVTDAMFTAPANYPFSEIIYNPTAKCAFARNDKGTVRADVGDWIVKYPNGDFRMFTDAAFLESFLTA